MEQPHTEITSNGETILLPVDLSTLTPQQREVLLQTLERYLSIHHEGPQDAMSGEPFSEGLQAIYPDLYKSIVGEEKGIGEA